MSNHSGDRDYCFSRGTIPRVVVNLHGTQKCRAGAFRTRKKNGALSYSRGPNTSSFPRICLLFSQGLMA